MTVLNFRVDGMIGLVTWMTFCGVSLHTELRSGGGTLLGGGGAFRTGTRILWRLRCFFASCQIL